MRKSYAILLPPCIFIFLLWSGCRENNTLSDKPWSVRMIESEMERSPQGWMLNFSKDLSWNYCHGLVCSAMLETSSYYGTYKYYDYVEQYADTMILDGGYIIGYRQEDYLLSALNPGNILFPLYEKEQKAKYQSAMHLLHDQLRTHPRTSEGGLWHKAITTSQIWLDGIYMILPFYMEYAKRFNEPEIFDDAILQIELIRKHHYDAETGLYRHGWDETRQQLWADSTGRSPHTWGRAQGWFMMGIVDALDYIPETHPKRETVIHIYKEAVEAITRFQDKESGLWYQVMDKPGEKGNFQESSVSCMLIYSILKGIRKGYIDSAMYSKSAQKAYTGTLKQFITINNDHTISIDQCCEVGGLGGKPYRDGSYEYYIQTPIRENDPKAVGTFILASLEIERLQHADTN